MSPTSHQSLTNSTQRRLGEYLQAAGLLNSEQLDEAIEYQCIYGGKLGTSLIELGLIDEGQLAKALSKQLQLHHIKPDLLMNVSASVLKLVPGKTALKYQIVPYYEDGKKLYIAMNEARDLALIDELSFQLDHIIIPLAVPEVRLLLALQKHYGMVLSPRFETLAKQMDRRMLAAQKKKSKKPAIASTPIEETDPEMPDKNVAAWPLLGDENYPGEEPTDDNYFASKSAATEENSVDLLEQLADAKERDDIAEAIIGYLKTDFPDCALLMVRANLATGWLASNNKTTQNFEQINIPIQEKSVFHLVATSHSPYLGPVADSVQNRKILDYFSSPPQINSLIFPVLVRKRLVSILYIQGQLEELEHRLVEIQNIVDKAEMSFQLLIMRNKILTV
ncbi:MAG: hypothetical protein U9Q61_05440 [Thermodesulfobacteriota bacterium]|nr:hypothetical protein [Thermodesulfobacteriota bacterium]